MNIKAITEAYMEMKITIGMLANSVSTGESYDIPTY